ncbi:hypothetical protein [Streptomyces sp. NPDC088736]|uniref:hypothetical protein n=1 Tax=Streptomyces sp. NPDC088736 TaxID=3365881 RepID=UPI0038258215
MTETTPADQAALAKRITDAVQNVLPMSSSLACAVVAEAVLAVLPASADRAEILRDFLWRLEQSAGDATAEKFLDDNDELRRLADAASGPGRAASETQQDETACPHPHGKSGIASLLEHVGVDTSRGVTVDGRTVAAPCTCGGQFPLHHLHADTHQPAAVSQPETEA